MVTVSWLRVVQFTKCGSGVAGGGGEAGGGGAGAEERGGETAPEGERSGLTTEEESGQIVFYRLLDQSYSPVPGRYLPKDIPVPVS